MGVEWRIEFGFVEFLEVSGPRFVDRGDQRLWFTID